jgi:hypothetical protein
MDYDLMEDPDAPAQLEDAFNRAITPNGDYFGEAEAREGKGER